MEVIYKAKDGKIFTDESECMVYEGTLLMTELEKQNKLILLDCDGNEMQGTLIDKIQGATFLYIEDSNTFREIKDIAYAEGIAFPSYNGIWYYNDETDGYENLEEVVANLKDDFIFFVKMRNKLINKKES